VRLNNITYRSLNHFTFHITKFASVFEIRKLERIVKGSCFFVYQL